MDEAITLFSGEKDEETARRVWLVEPVSEIMKKYRKSIVSLRDYMHSQGLECKAEDVFNLKGDAAKCGFINCFKEVQRYKTQLEQYTDISEHLGNCLAEPMAEYGLLPEDSLRAFRGAYLEMAKELKGKREKKHEDVDPQIEELDFELVLFASALIDYDYIMLLIARYVSEPTNIRMTKDELIGLIMSSANLLDERDDIRAYIDSLDGVNGREVDDIKRGYEDFKISRNTEELKKVAQKHQLSVTELKAFADDIVARRIFDGEKLGDLLAPLDLGWRARTLKETELMNDLSPLLRRMADGQEISGLSAYEE